MTLEYMIAVIQCYIHHMKGVEINISIDPRNPRDIMLVHTAYSVAANNIKIVK